MRVIKRLKNIWGITILALFIVASFGYFAYIQSLSRDYYLIVTKTQEMKLLDKDIKLFLNGRFVQTNFDDIVSITDKFECIMEQTGVLVDGYGDTKLSASFASLQKLFSNRKELTERHKADNALLNNSFRYLYDLKIGMENSAGCRTYQESLDKVMYGFAELLMDGFSDKDMLSKEIQTLRQEHNKHKEDEYLGYFMVHAEFILSKLEDIDAVSKSTEEDRLTGGLENFLQSYNADYAARQQRQDYLFLAIIGLAMLLLAGVAYHMQKEEEAKAQLEELSRRLEARVEEEVAKNREKDRLFMHQSRLVAMGEMISNIAHQWRQPLNALILILQNIRFDYEEGALSKEGINDYVGKADTLVQSMSRTIDDFRNFFKPSKKAEDFLVGKTIDRAVSMIADIYRSAGIRIDLNIPSDTVIHGYSGEFAQAVLTILANAKDAIVANGVRSGHISVDVVSDGDSVSVMVSDNGGGVPNSVKDKIFDPYFTTKHKSQGVGIGLYMTKNIIEKNMNGHLSAENIENGARFTIKIPTTNKEQS